MADRDDALVSAMGRAGGMGGGLIQQGPIVCDCGANAWKVVRGDDPADEASYRYQLNFTCTSCEASITWMPRR